MAAYQSELTGFLKTLKQQRPEIEEKQREGRALWWDRPTDPDDARRWQASRVAQSAYVYYAAQPAAPATGTPPAKAS
jgi:hypothetical protein